MLHLNAADFHAVLSDYWKELLEVDDIPKDAYFIELGGNSLLATVLASRIEEDYGVRLALEDIFVSSLDELATLCVQESTREQASRV